MTLTRSLSTYDRLSCAICSPTCTADDFALNDLTRMDWGDIGVDLPDTHPAQQTGGRLAQQARTTVNSVTPFSRP
jgi:hypothetical protein